MNGMASLLAGLRALGPMKLGALGLVAVVSLGLVGMLAFQTSATPMSLLYGDLELRDAGQITDQLDRARIPHETQAGGSRILVPSSQVDRARMLLAKEGLPSGGSIGYEIFDRSDGLTASAFQQQVSQTRALEGELARTIRSLNGVRSVRVHLVLGKREPFARDRQEAQASVVLAMNGATRLDREGVQAVLNLIAAAVPGLKPKNIAIIDSRGNLLARAGEPEPGLASAQSGEEIKRATETRISHAVEEMLERSLGPGRVRAEATVDLDFNQVRETSEKFDPDGQVVRSQQSSGSNSRSTEAQQNVSVQNNLPNPDPQGGAAAGTQDQKTDETTNYEISKVVRTVVREQPQLRRLSLAVMVDGVTTTGPDGQPVWAPRPTEELARITNLVRSAVGYDEKRGDAVEVVSMRFASPPELAAPPALPIWEQLDKADFIRLTQAGLTALAVVLCLLLVLRPLVMRLSMPGGAGNALPGMPRLAGAAAGVAGAIAVAGSGSGSGSGSGAVLEAVDGGGEMVQLANVEGEMRLASVRGVAALVDSNPDETIAMLRGWLVPENES